VWLAYPLDTLMRWVDMASLRTVTLN
jgi:hypothetical protein